MSGILVTTNAKHTITRACVMISSPPPNKYPKNWLSGDTTYYFPGASLNRFPIGSILKEITA